MTAGLSAFKSGQNPKMGRKPKTRRGDDYVEGQLPDLHSIRVPSEIQMFDAE